MRKRVIGFLLALVLIIGMAPGSVFAEEETDSEAASKTETTVEEKQDSMEEDGSIDLEEARRLSELLDSDSNPPAELMEASSALSVSEAGIQFLCSVEGFSATCYQDGTQSSIGYGSKCTGAAEQPHAAGLHSITKEQAKDRMESSIATTYAPRVRKQTADVSMNQSQFDALVSLCYNCGGGTSLISNSPLVRYLRGELTEAEARSEYSNYIVYFSGKVSQGLINRRNKEAELFFANNNTAALNAATNPFPRLQTINGVTTVRCTYYAWQQVYDNLGIALPAWGNGGQWYDNAKAAGYSTGTSAAAHSLAVWKDSSYGHVAYVTAVNGNKMTVNEGGRTDYASTTQGVVNGANVSSSVGSTRSSGKQTLVGFVY